MPHSLHKGQRAEREIIQRLQPIIDHAYGTVGWEAPQLERRGLGLSGQDILGISWLALEIKHREVLQIESWWEQTKEQAKRLNGYRATPVLAYKRNHVPWRVRMPGFAADHVMHACIVDIAFEDFEYWFYNRLLKEIEAECDSRSKGS